MAKYIDAAAFAGGTLTSSENQLRFREMTGQEAYFEFLRMVNDAPAADVEPVVHGQWIAVPSSDMMTGKAYICSECKKMRWGAFAPNYCQNCGARMDGGADHAE